MGRLVIVARSNVRAARVHVGGDGNETQIGVNLLREVIPGGCGTAAWPDSEIVREVSHLKPLLELP